MQHILTTITPLYHDIQEAYRNVVAATRNCNAFPQGAARSLYLSYPGYARMLEEQSQRVLGLINKVLKTENISGDIKRCAAILFRHIQT